MSKPEKKKEPLKHEPPLKINWGFLEVFKVLKKIESQNAKKTE